MAKIDERAVNSILHQFTGDSVANAALLLQGDKAVAQAGQLNRQQVKQLAAMIGAITWPSQTAAQIQYVNIANYESSLLLYIRPVVDDFSLALAAPARTDLHRVRPLADTLALRLTTMVRYEPAATGDMATILINNEEAAQRANNAFCLLWRTMVALPEALHGVMCQTLIRLAQNHDSHLIHLAVQPSYVQLIVDCPAGRNSAWAAYQFKITLEQEIQKQYNIGAALWAKGYYATQTTSPLNETELALFLQKE